MKRVAIIQSSYIPWRGFFAAIALCETFVFFDSVQFTRRDWRTRNVIKTPQGVHWLSVPVQQKGNFHAPIDSMRIADPGWWQAHLKSIEIAYRRATHFDDAFPLVRRLFETIADLPTLSQVNQGMITALCKELGIETRLLRDIDLLPREAMAAMRPTERLVKLSAAADAQIYLSGPSAKSYLDEDEFNALGMQVEWMDYSRFGEPYPQVWGDFASGVSIVDTLLNLGLDQTRAIVLGRYRGVAA
ncbi:WbqC family protein [Bosea sp. F3-2]|uniref:WbqC family protein n=1 Tax=Bosea sp. F3-2 TaxID=2599640 RepID=UPI0011EC860A|nr:WbqC family protein [Bosea sp. F3-2]QEL21708.1 WbqC family protein [Bosea sp. F3-2]